MDGDKPFRSDIRETFVSFIISFINLGKTKIGKLFSSFSSDMQIFVSLGIVMSVPCWVASLCRNATLLFQVVDEKEFLVQLLV